MSSPNPPTSYALEKAVRVASRKLGRTASAQDVEQEALRLLGEDGHMPALPASMSHSSGQWAGYASDSSKHARLHLSISAAGCASRRLTTQRARLYDLLRKHLLMLPDSNRSETCLHVRDTSSLFIGHGPEAVMVMAETLSDVASDFNPACIFGPFIDAALPENIGLLEQLPDLVNGVSGICPIIQLSTMDNGHSEACLEALVYALALSSDGGHRKQSVLLSINDCDRRAFGHRVHAETAIVHDRSDRVSPGEVLAGLNIPDAWLRVASADLPILPSAPPERTTDHIQPLPTGNPDAIKQIIHEQLLDHARSGARKQLLFLC